ncbi:peptidylprolyl isomerase [Candidatus Chlorohelix sp.]|uniref:peptidylprolyl isomerase n=1 Tax=Candidatus Chlorohelix sp. TaxID=3139201 RepID=UPI00302BCB1B
MKKLFPLIILFLLLSACGDAVLPTSQITKSSGGLLPFPTPSSNLRIGYAIGAVAKVNGTEISADEFNQALDQARVTSEEQNGGVIDWDTETNKTRLKELRDQILQGLINYTVVALAAHKENTTVSAEEVTKQLENFKKQIGGEETYKIWLSRRFMSDNDNRHTIEQGLLFSKMLEQHATVQDKEEQVKVRHILLGSEKEAKDIFARLQQGADFAALATQFSLDIASAKKGGDLDWVFKGQTEPAFEQAAFALKIGTFSGSIKTSLGWHIIKVEAREVRQLPLDLVEQRRQEAFGAYIKVLRDHAIIEVLLNT